MADKSEETSNPRKIDSAYLGWMRFFFCAAHFVVPLAAVGLLLFYVLANLGCHRFELSWPFLLVFGVALLPFLLPLVSAYIGKIGPVEMRDDTPRETTIPRKPAPEAAPPPLGGAPAEAAAPAAGPNFDALTEDEKSVLKTLWVHQPNHTASGGAGWWSFNVPTNSPTYKNFIRGAGTLAERKLVGIDKGMVHLNDQGLAYCDLNKEQLAKVVSYWSVFRPA